MSTNKVKTQTRFMVLFNPGHHSLKGISRHSAWHLPQVFTCYLPLTIAFLHLYRDYTMTEYAFFCWKGGEVWEGHDASVGKSQHLPPPELPRKPTPFLWGTTFH